MADFGRRQRRSREALERLLRRPAFWRKDPPLPVVVVTGPDGSGTEAARWLTEPFEDHLPFARVPATGDRTLRQLIELLADEGGRLGEPVSGSFLPAPRFPLVQFALWALTQRDRPPSTWDDTHGEPWPPDPRSGAGRKMFKERLKQWRWDQAQGTGKAVLRSADFFARAAPTWVPAGIVIALGAGWITDVVGVVQWIAGAAVAIVGTVGQTWLSIRGSIFNRWFKRQPYITRRPFEKLWAYGLRVAQAPEEDAERLLVHAMFEDLRQAYRKWPIPWPSWGRGLYCLLVLEAGGPRSANARFLNVMRDVIDETGRFVPLVVIVSASQADSLERRPVAQGSMESFEDVASEWRRRRDLRVPPLGMVLRVTDDLPTAPYGPRLIPVRARAWIYWAAVFSLMAAPLAYARAATLGCGGGLMEEFGQCVGLSDDLGRLRPDPLVRPALERIQEENARIPADHGRIVTVFFMGPLTRDPLLKSGDQFNGVLGELAGLHARQRQYNRQSGDWQVRVEFANVGQDFRSASYAAEVVEERAERDRGAAAVIGLAWSRKETQEAIRILGRAQLPMLSTTNSADGTPRVNGDRSSPYFFRMAAPNSAQAKAMRWWLSRGLPGGTGPVPVAKVATLEQRSPDGKDIYSADLTRELHTQLPDLPAALPFSTRTELSSQVDAACRNGARILVYTGRTTFLDTLLDDGEKVCDPSTQILAGDEVTVTVAEMRRWSGPRMNFVSLTDISTRIVPGNAAIDEAVGELPKAAASVTSRVHARLAYDALLAVTYALDDLLRQQSGQPGDALDIAAGVHYNLRGLRAGSPVSGASGAFSFEPGATDHTATPRSLWLFSVSQTEGIRPHGSCTVISARVECRSGP
ncbi:hypothetical protein ACLQ2R_04120 [Streptosporangium sp. DT93]|uniref:hypothetical protein n=1 Tax=Streptosporangium sp. DT93 TaxID=3393428 RepID=UPI003CF55308